MFWNNLFMRFFPPWSFQNVSVNASIFTLTAIAVDRYKAIVYPLSNHASKQRTKVRVWPVVAPQDQVFLGSNPAVCWTFFLLLLSYLTS